MWLAPLPSCLAAQLAPEEAGPGTRPGLGVGSQMPGGTESVQAGTTSTPGAGRPVPRGQDPSQVPQPVHWAGERGWSQRQAAGKERPWASEDAALAHNGRARRRWCPCRVILARRPHVLDGRSWSYWGRVLGHRPRGQERPRGAEGGSVRSAGPGSRAAWRKGQEARNFASSSVNAPTPSRIKRSRARTSLRPAAKSPPSNAGVGRFSPWLGN